MKQYRTVATGQGINVALLCVFRIMVFQLGRRWHSGVNSFVERSEWSSKLNVIMGKKAKAELKQAIITALENGDMDGDDDVSTT